MVGWPGRLTAAGVTASMILYLTYISIESSSSPHLETTCNFIPIPTLTGRYKTALSCHPLLSSTNNNDNNDDNTNNTYPLHIFAHGDFGGGTILLRQYKRYLQSISSLGFVTVAFASCPIDYACHGGQTYLLEALETIAHLEDHPPVDLPLDLTLPYSASGHSTGGRAVLMLAAARDHPDYLRSVDYLRLTERHRRILRKIVAVAADHPDPMYDPALNPDVDRYGITRTPTMIVTGTRDVSPLGEPVGSAWENFVGLDGLEDRVFLNVAGVTHAQPVVSHGEARYIAYFSRFHVLGDESAGRMVYGEADGSLFDLWKRGEFVTGVGGRNNGGNGKEVGFFGVWGGR